MTPIRDLAKWFIAAFKEACAAVGRAAALLDAHVLDMRALYMAAWRAREAMQGRSIAA